MIKKKTKVEGYYECKECNISSLTKGRMCPCPRGSCDAVKKGEVVTTTEVKLSKPSYFK